MPSRPARMQSPVRLYLCKCLDDQGRIARFNVRIAAKGFAHDSDVDYDQAVAPVRPLDVRLQLSESLHHWPGLSIMPTF